MNSPVRVTEYRGHKLTIRINSFRVQSDDQDLPDTDKRVEYDEEDTASNLAVLDGNVHELLDLRQACAEFLVDQLIREALDAGFMFPAYI